MKVDLDGLARNIKSCIDPAKDTGGWAYMVDEMVAYIRQLESNVGGGDTAMTAMGLEIEHMQDEIGRLKEGLQMIGQIIHGSTRWTRNIALAVLAGTDCRVLEEVEKIGKV